MYNPLKTDHPLQQNSVVKAKDNIYYLKSARLSRVELLCQRDGRKATNDSVYHTVLFPPVDRAVCRRCIAIYQHQQNSVVMRRLLGKSALKLSLNVRGFGHQRRFGA